MSPGRTAVAGVYGWRYQRFVELPNRLGHRPDEFYADLGRGGGECLAQVVQGLLAFLGEGAVLARLEPGGDGNAYGVGDGVGAHACA